MVPLQPTKIIFDFDFCLFDTNSMRASLGPLFACFFTQYEFFSAFSIEDLVDRAWVTAPHDLVQQLALPADISATYLTFYRQLPVPPEAKLYPEVWEVLSWLRDQRFEMWLVTKGVESFQAAKVAHCGIAPFLTDILYVGPESVVKTKHEAMEGIITRYQLDPVNVWVVGDSSDELTAGQELGLTTVQTLRPGIKKLTATYYANDLHYLERLRPEA